MIQLQPENRKALKNMQGRYGMISTLGKWFEVRAEGVGTICVRELFPYAAVEEAAGRWGMEPEELGKLCTVRELPS